MRISVHPAEVRAMREAAGDSTAQAAARVQVSQRAWQSYENEGEHRRGMPPDRFASYRTKTAKARAKRAKAAAT